MKGAEQGEHYIHRDKYSEVKQNVMDFSTSNNSMIQDNYEGPISKNAIHILRKNYETKKKEKKTTA